MSRPSELREQFEALMAEADALLDRAHARIRDADRAGRRASPQVQRLLDRAARYSDRATTVLEQLIEMEPRGQAPEPSPAWVRFAELCCEDAEYARTHGGHRLYRCVDRETGVAIDPGTRS